MPRPCPSTAISALLGALALAGASALIGIACGAAATPKKPLPPAGTLHDDGSGVLASASGEDTLFHLWQRDPSAPDHQPATYGGRGARGNELGGTRYGDYRFDWRERELSPPFERRHGPSYQGTDIPSAGSIHGTIVWKRPPRASRSLHTTIEGCPSELENPTLVLDHQARVANAVVFLEDITAGRRGLVTGAHESVTLQRGGTLRIEGCRFTPQVQVLSPVGATLDLLGDATAPSELTMTRGSDTTLRLSLTPGIPAQVQLTEPGFWHLRDTRAPAGAWVILAPHPYYTVSADDGTFRLHQVPPGEYTLVVWHQPVLFEAPGRTSTQSAPLMHRTRIRVSAGQREQLDIKLPRATP